MQLITKPADDYLLIKHRKRKWDGIRWLTFKGEIGIFPTFGQASISIADSYRGIKITIKPTYKTYFRVYGSLRDFAILDDELPDSLSNIYIHRSYLSSFIDSPSIPIDVAENNWDKMYGILFDLEPSYPTVYIIRAKNYIRIEIPLVAGNDKEFFFNEIVSKVLDDQKVIGLYMLIKDKLVDFLLMLDDNAREFVEKIIAADCYMARHNIADKGCVVKKMLDNLDEYSRLGREYLDSKQKPIVNTS
jgi:hypothetical protein